jgi:hypothetical protein
MVKVSSGSFHRFEDPKNMHFSCRHNRSNPLIDRLAKEEVQKQNGKSINEKVVHFAEIGAKMRVSIRMSRVNIIYSKK